MTEAESPAARDSGLEGASLAPAGSAGPEALSPVLTRASGNAARVISAVAGGAVGAGRCGIAWICRSSAAMGRIMLLGSASSVPRSGDVKLLFINKKYTGLTVLRVTRCAFHPIFFRYYPDVTAEG